MKKKHINLLAIYLYCSLCCAQQIYFVTKNHIPGGSNFESLTDAIAIAEPGSIIYIRGGNFVGGTVNKKLKLIGEGLVRDSLNNTFSGETRISAINFQEGSEGSEITGCRLDYIRLLHADSIKILSNIINRGILIDSSDIIQVSMNQFNGTGAVTYRSSSTFNPSFVYSNIYMNDCRNSMINNNMFPRRVSQLRSTHYAIETNSQNTENIIVANNMIRSDITDIKDGNIINNIFTNSIRFNEYEYNYYSTDDASEEFIPGSYLMLEENSAAKTAGLNSSECGIYGGSTPFNSEFIINRPVVYQLNVEPTAVQGTSLHINIKAKVN